MRIIGGHDYYDGGLVYGFDPNIVFIRHKEDFRPNNYLPAPKTRRKIEIFYTDETLNRKRHYFFHPSVNIDLFLVVVYVAGVRYPGIKVVVTSKEIPYEQESSYFWSRKSLESYLNGFGATTKKEKISKYYWRSYYANKHLEEHFEEFETKNQFQQCVNDRIVIATFESTPKENTEWRVNGDNLKNFQFYKVLDTYKCYQEISMFVGGVLPEENKMVEINPANKISKHGFDKWSFRKMPEKKIGDHE